MTDNTFPSVDPADDGTLTGLMRLAATKALQGFDVMMPVEVVSYDRATNRATIKHMIQMQGTDGQKVSRAQVSSVRVYQFGNGAYSLSLPIQPGDKGWLKAADRDISIFQQDVTKEDAPNTARMHSFQDSVFFPDAMAAGDAPAGQGDRVVMGNASGGTFFSWDDDGFYFTVGSVTMTLTAAGLVVNGATITNDGKNVGSTHVHTDVTPGSSNTGEPA